MSYKELDELLGARADNIAAHVQAIYDYLENIPNEQQRLEAFQYVVENFGEKPISGQEIKGPSIPDEEWERLRQELSQVADGFLRRLYLKRLEPSDFATQLWRFITSFSDRNERIFVLAWILFDRTMPYIKLPDSPLRMDRQRYVVLVNKLKDDIRLIKVIINVGFETKPETASLILKVIDKHENFEERVVLLANALDEAMEKVERAARTRLRELEDTVAALRGRVP